MKHQSCELFGIYNSTFPIDKCHQNHFDKVFVTFIHPKLSRFLTVLTLTYLQKCATKIRSISRWGSLSGPLMAPGIFYDFYILMKLESLFIVRLHVALASLPVFKFFHCSLNSPFLFSSSGPSLHANFFLDFFLRVCLLDLTLKDIIMTRMIKRHPFAHVP